MYSTNKKIDLFINNSFSYFSVDSFEEYPDFQTIFNELAKILSYEIPGASFSKLPSFLKTKYLFAKGKTNGHYYFPTGLLHQVIDYLKNKNINFQITDQRIKPKSKSTLNFSSRNIPPLRKYQEIIVSKAIEDCRGVIESATGTGKTRILIELINRLNLKTLVIVPSLSILEQTKNQLINSFGKTKVGGIENSSNKQKQIVISNYQSLEKLEDKFWNSIDLLIIDEFHHSSANTFQKLNKKFNSIFYRVGLSLVGDSSITIKSNNIIKNISMEHLADQFNTEIDQIVNISKSNLEVRSWDFNQNKACWKTITHIHKYNHKKELYRITTQYGRKITATGDHSLFKIHPKKYFYNNQNVKRCSSFEVIDVPTSELKVNDILLMETSIDSKIISYNIDIFKLIKKAEKEKIYGLVSIADIDKLKNLLPQDRYRYKYGKYGPFLPLAFIEKPLEHYFYKSRQIDRFPKTVKWNENLSYLLGYFLGDGFISDRKKYARGHRIVLCANPKDLEILYRLIEELKQTFPDLLYKTYKTKGNSYEIVISCPSLYYVILSLVGNQKAKTKKIPNFIYNLPLKSKKKFLDGLIQSDGHLNKNNSYVYTTTSQELARGLVTLLKTMNILCSTFLTATTNPDNRNLKSKVHRIMFGFKTNQRMNSYNAIIRHNKSYLPVKIKNIENLGITNEPVYDLSVKETEAFFANDILAHNTGTNFRNDGTDLALQGVLSHVIYKYDAVTAINEGFLCKPKFYTINYAHNGFTTNNSWLSEYKAGIVENVDYNKNVAFIANKLITLQAPTLVFVDEIAHGKLLEKLIPKSRFVNGTQKSDINNKLISDFNSGKLNCLIGTSVIGEGVDTVRASHAIMAGVGKAKSEIIQKIGRVLRPHPNKKNAVIVDFIHNYRHFLYRHSLDRIEIYKQYQSDILQIGLDEINKVFNE